MRCRRHRYHTARVREEGGVPLKPLPRKRIPPDIRSLARAHTNSCIARLAALVTSPGKDQSNSISVAAANILLERGWGKPVQPVAGDADGGDIKILIRKMLTDE